MKRTPLILILSIILISFSSCKKKKIDKNLNGTWALSELIIDGYNEVTVNTSITMEFSNVEKGEGNVTIVSTDAQGSHYDLGTITIDDKYEKMQMTIPTGILDGDFTVDETTFEYNGTFTLIPNGDVLTMKMKGTKN